MEHGDASRGFPDGDNGAVSVDSEGKSSESRPDSDSHRPEAINSGRQAALEALSASGFREVMELHDGQWISVPIEL